MSNINTRHSREQLPTIGTNDSVVAVHNRQGGDEGVPAMVGKEEIAKNALRAVVSNAVRQIAIRNANMPKTQTIAVA